MVEPPSLVGAVHDRLICDDEIVLAVRFVGGPGAICALAGAANMLDDNKRKAKIPISKFILLIFFIVFLFNIFLPYFFIKPYTIYLASKILLEQFYITWCRYMVCYWHKSRFDQHLESTCMIIV